MNYPMRKSNKQITDRSVLEKIIEDSVVCRLALADGDWPYIVPLNFGYSDGTLYFHCAPEGRKLSIIKANPNACLEFEANTHIITADKPCGWTMRYQSVIGYGKAYQVEDDREKRMGLNIIMQHYSGSGSHMFPDDIVLKTAIVKVEIEHMTGKQSGI